MRFFLSSIILIFSMQTLAVPFEGQKIVIAGPTHHAVEVGKSIYRQGGNVADVTVAIGLTLAVTSPYFAAFGAGGFAMIKMGKDTKAMDFREKAPKATHPKFYVERKNKKDSRQGGAAVGVPGFLAGLWEIHQKYGKLAWEKLFWHPLRMAKQGFHVSGEWVKLTNRKKKDFSPGGIKHFLNNGQSLKPGDLLKQKGLAQAIKLIQRKGIKPFYDGPIGRDIVASIQKAGGVMTEQDLKDYKVRHLDPIKTKFAGHDLFLMPPPSSGGILLKLGFKMIEDMNLKQHKPLSVNELHLFSEIMSRMFRGRSLLGDPDFHNNPLKELASDKYAKEMAALIDMKESKKLSPVTKTSELSIKESKETTHFSVMDNKGNAIALTVTLNGPYGSAVVSEKYGIALNNEMDDFTTRPGEPNMFGLIQGEGNSVEAGKRPLSSMSPTIATKNGKAVLAIGAQGGPTIINGVLQATYRTLVNGWNIDKAIQAPRVHHQFLPHRITVDKDRLSPDVLDMLRARKHKIRENWVAKTYGVRINEKGVLEAAYDMRSEGAAGGY